MTKYCRIFLRKENVSKPIIIQNEENNFYSIFSFLQIVPVSENVETYGRSKYGKRDNIIRSIRFECFLYKARDTHSEYVEYIAVLLQEYLLNRDTI